MPPEKKNDQRLLLSDFTTESYAELLILAQENYTFTSYDQINTDNKFILWRHDVDFSLNRSLKLAQIEHEAGVRSTFFLNPHSDFYNLLENHNPLLSRKF